MVSESWYQVPSGHSQVILVIRENKNSHHLSTVHKHISTHLTLTVRRKRESQVVWKILPEAKQTQFFLTKLISLQKQLGPDIALKLKFIASHLFSKAMFPFYRLYNVCIYMYIPELLKYTCLSTMKRLHIVSYASTQAKCQRYKA